MKTCYIIKETNGKWNFAIVAVVYGKRNIVLTSAGQCYTRKIDCWKVFKENCKAMPMQEITRAAFNAKIRKK